MAIATAPKERQDKCPTDIQAFRSLIRAGFEISGFRCFTEDKPCIVWEAKSSFLPPLYSRSLRDLHAGCKSCVAAALDGRSHAATASASRV